MFQSLVPCSIATAMVLGPVTAAARPASPQAAAKAPATFVLLNGSVHTVNDTQPKAEAVAVRGDRLVEVGSNRGARAFIGKGTRTVDLRGRLLLPDFIESHIHLLMGAATTSGLALSMTDSLADIQRKLRDYARGHPDRPVIFVSACNGLLFGESGPRREWLDAVVSDRPVILADHTRLRCR